jgi:hypothetical protein
MMDGYIAFLEKLFPAIDPYTANRAKDAVRNFADHYDVKTRFFTSPLDQDFQQGDIFSRVPFVYIDRQGQAKVAMMGGMLITNSCDCTRNDQLQFAAVSSLTEYSNSAEYIDAVKSNINYQYIYFPDKETEDSFVNLGLITSISRKAFEAFVAAGKSERIASLNSTGYFLFITKLTVFFMRPEDSEVYASRYGTSSM